jgi:hypothetical protein
VGRDRLLVGFDLRFVGRDLLRIAPDLFLVAQQRLLVLNDLICGGLQAGLDHLGRFDVVAIDGDRCRHNPALSIPGPVD